MLFYFSAGRVHACVELAVWHTALRVIEMVYIDAARSDFSMFSSICAATNKN